AGVQTARILYYEADGDLYVRTLRKATRDALTHAGVIVEPDFDWTQQSAPFRAICRYPGMLLYAGRGDDFEKFLGEFAKQCPNMRPQHPIVAGDAVSRLIEDPARRQDTHSTLPLVYVSDAHLVTCEQQPAYDTWRAFRDRILADPFHVCAPDSRH